MNTLAFKLGDRGPVVAEIRARLARLGLLPGSQHAAQNAERNSLRAGPTDDHSDPAHWQTTALVSADYDQDVVEAVKRFQSERGITDDGIVGPETFRRLEEARWQIGDRVLSYSPAKLTIGEDVTALQHRLNALGFFCGREDGSLGPQTDQGIREFQRNTGLPVDGICGPETFRAIDRLRRTVGKHSANTVREKSALPALRTGIRGKQVMLGPASNTRAVGAGPTEENRIVSALASIVEGQLTELGAQVLTNRPLLESTTTGDTAREQASFANQHGADLVLSLSVCNDPERGPGVATYYFGRPDGPLSVAGKLAASILLDRITTVTGMVARETDGRTWDILRMTKMPAVRIQCGNLAHSEDRERLTDPELVAELARAIGEAVEQFFAPEHIL